MMSSPVKFFDTPSSDCVARPPPVRKVVLLLSSEPAGADLNEAAFQLAMRTLENGDHAYLVHAVEEHKHPKDMVLTLTGPEHLNTKKEDDLNIRMGKVCLLRYSERITHHKVTVHRVLLKTEKTKRAAVLEWLTANGPIDHIIVGAKPLGKVAGYVSKHAGLSFADHIRRHAQNVEVVTAARRTSRSNSLSPSPTTSPQGGSRRPSVTGSVTGRQHSRDPSRGSGSDDRAVERRPHSREASTESQSDFKQHKREASRGSQASDRERDEN